MCYIHISLIYFSKNFANTFFLCTGFDRFVNKKIGRGSRWDDIGRRF